jgi:hypothetical protein
MATLNDTAPGTSPAAHCNDLHVTVYGTASRIATLGNLIQDMGLDGLPDDTDDHIEYLSRLDALGVCVHDLAKQIVAQVDTWAGKSKYPVPVALDELSYVSGWHEGKSDLKWAREIRRLSPEARKNICDLIELFKKI